MKIELDVWQKRSEMLRLPSMVFIIRKIHSMKIYLGKHVENDWCWKRRSNGKCNRDRFYLPCKPACTTNNMMRLLDICIWLYDRLRFYPHRINHMVYRTKYIFLLYLFRTCDFFYIGIGIDFSYICRYSRQHTNALYLLWHFRFFTVKL